MPDSPIAAMLDALHDLDVDAFTSMFAGDGRLTLTEGSVAVGTEQIRAAITAFMADLTATTYELLAEWHPAEGVWIAELQATYEHKRHGSCGPYPRAIVLRDGPDGIVDARVYGRPDVPPIDSAHHYQEVPAGGRWLATL